MKRWPQQHAYFWERAPFFRVLLPLVLAIVCYGQGWLHWLSLQWAIVALALCIIVLMTTAILKKPSNYLLTYISANIAIFLCGYAVCYNNDIKNDPAWFGHNIAAANCTVARIVEAPAAKERTYKLTLSVVGEIVANKCRPVTGKAFVYVRKEQAPLALQAGDTILLPKQWQPIKNSGNPFEFNYARYCEQNNIHYQQFLTQADVKLYARGAATDISLVERTHNWCMGQLDTYLKDSTAKGLVQAMLLGDEVNLDPQLRTSYAATGIIHIIAISGGNIGFFFILIGWLLLWVRHKKYDWIKYLIALPIVWFYVVVAGAPPSAVRAAIMFSVIAFGIMLQRNRNPLNFLFATACLLLLAQPMWLYSVGFQLSFVAVLSLILFYGRLYSLYRPKNKIAKNLWATIVASISAEILTAPLVVYYFHIFPLAFIITNVVAYVFMGLVLILGMLIIVFSFAPFIAKIIAFSTTWLVFIFDKIVDILQALNPASFYYLRLSAFELIILFATIAGVAAFILSKNKRGLFVGLGTLCMLMLSFCINEWTSLKQEKLVVYNASRANYVEQVYGKRYFTWSTDTSSQAKKSYILSPAHTNWGAWQEGNGFIDDDIAIVGGYTVLLLNHPLPCRKPFTVDYLIINYVSGQIELPRLQQAFHPKKIISSNIHTRPDLDKMAADSRKFSLPLHFVATDGAFILNGN